MVKWGYRLCMPVIFVLFLLVIAAPVSANPPDAAIQDNTITPQYYRHDNRHDKNEGHQRPGWHRRPDGPRWHDGWGREGWHHRYSRHGHSHHHIPPHERHRHHGCRYSPHDGLWHFPL